MNGDSQNRKNWWTWVTRTILIVSLVVNIALWFKTENLNNLIELATYNDKAWKAISKFTKQMDELNEKAYFELSSLLKDSPLSEGWIQDIKGIDDLWFDNTVRNIAELKTKIRSYNAIIWPRSSLNRGEIEASLFARKQINNLSSPLRRTLDAIDARIAERNRILFSESLPWPGESYIEHGLRKLKHLRKAIAEKIEKSEKIVKYQYPDLGSL